MIITIVITVVMGVLLGYITSARTPSDGIEDLTRNVMIGMVGAFVGLQVAARTFASGENGTSVFALVFAAIVGGSVLLFVIGRIRRA